MTRRGFASGVLVLFLVAGCSGGSDTPAGRAGGATAASTGSAPDRAASAAAARLDACPPSDGPVPATDALPDISLPCLGRGPQVSLARLGTGVPTVVNLWATWCVPCAREMPFFAAAHERAGDRVRFLGVLTEDPSQRWGELLETTGAFYAAVRDDDADLRTSVGVFGMPLTLFVRADGSLAHKEVGEVSSQAELDRLIESHLGVRV